MAYDICMQPGIMERRRKQEAQIAKSKCFINGRGKRRQQKIAALYSNSRKKWKNVQNEKRKTHKQRLSCARAEAAAAASKSGWSWPMELVIQSQLCVYRRKRVHSTIWYGFQFQFLYATHSQSNAYSHTHTQIRQPLVFTMANG